MKIHERENFIFLQNTREKGRHPEYSPSTSDHKYLIFKIVNGTNR